MFLSQTVPVVEDAAYQFEWNLGMWLIERYSLQGFWLGLVTVVSVFLCIAIPYLLGSINPAILFSKLIYKDDIRNHGSGNAGTTNMLRTFGLKAAALTLICDFLKAVIAVVIGRLLYSVEIGGAIAGLFVVFGHMFPVFYHFKGGKGVACAGMVALAINPIIFLFLVLIFVVITVGTRFVSLASVMCAFFYPLLFRAFFNRGLCVAMACMIMAFVIFMHRENIKRIMEHKESKIDLSRFSLKKRRERKKELAKAEKEARAAAEAEKEEKTEDGDDSSKR